MGKTIESYDQIMFAIRKEIVQCEFNCKQIDKQIDLHQSKIIEEKATGKKAKFYDWGVNAHIKIVKTDGIVKYIGRKAIIKRLAQSEAQMKRELKRLRNKIERMEVKRRKLKEKLVFQGKETLDTLLEPIEEPKELTLCSYCAYPLQEDVETCPVCGTQR
jgi:hypothetical protein